MRPILEAADQELVWQQPNAFKYEYELRAGDEVLATLRWRTLSGSLATAETAEGSWTFKRVGFWRARITARPLGSERDAATFEPRWTGSGTVTLAQGASHRWGPTNAWQTRWAWHDADGVPIVQFHNKHGAASEGYVEISPAAASLPPVTHLDETYRPIARGEEEPPPVALPELPLFLTLGWYLLVLAARDIAGTSGTGAVVAATTS
jgi:hypothetical protein